jgi:hypothetical protein
VPNNLSPLLETIEKFNYSALDSAVSAYSRLTSFNDTSGKFNAVKDAFEALKEKIRPSLDNDTNPTWQSFNDNCDARLDEIEKFDKFYKDLGTIRGIL